MYAILELEIKLTMEGSLEYVDPTIEVCETREEAIERVEQKKNEILSRNYFNKVIHESTSGNVTLYNGGTVYKDLKIVKIK